MILPRSEYDNYGNVVKERDTAERLMNRREIEAVKDEFTMAVVKAISDALISVGTWPCAAKIAIHQGSWEIDIVTGEFIGE